LSLSASAVSEPVTILRYFDVVLVVVAAPIMLLIGVPASGYGIAAGVWIALRAIGVAVDRAAATTANASTQITMRMLYMLGRLFTLALTVILVRLGAGKDAGLTALVVIVFAYTVQLGISAVTRPRSR
jgi:hypothetical protein